MQELKTLKQNFKNKKTEKSFCLFLKTNFFLLITNFLFFSLTFLFTTLPVQAQYKNNNAKNLLSKNLFSLNRQNLEEENLSPVKNSRPLSLPPAPPQNKHEKPYKNFFLQTKYFDIIYSAKSRDTAYLLAAHADDYADEIFSRLRLSFQETWRKRLSVYIVSNMQQLNAYFTAAPYNRIVLYDTTPAEGQLANDDNSILMLFYHELAHAVSLNIRPPFWKAMSVFIGDVVSPNMFFSMPLFFTEGIAVSLESSKGKGRLNDPLIYHYFSQDRLQKTSPSWQETAGARSIYPRAQWGYLYGGAFSSYLQKKYGWQLYAQLWKRGGSMGLFGDATIAQKFKAVYGVPLTYAWQDFLFSLPVPQDVQENKNNVYKQEKGLYKALASSPLGIAWVDAEKQAVYMRCLGGKVVKLFDADSSLQRLSFSQDGSLLLVSQSQSMGKYPQNIIRLFDVNKRKFLKEKYFSMRDAAFDKDSRYFYAVRFVEGHTQNNQLVIIDRISKQVHPLLLAGTGQPIAALYSPSYAGKKGIAVIALMASEYMAKKNMSLKVRNVKRRILFVDKEDATLSVLPEQAQIHVMRFLQSSFAGSCLTFSFVPSNQAQDLGHSLYRLAVYNFESEELSWQTKDISGGIFWPVMKKAQNLDRQDIYYVGIFSEYHSLLVYPSEQSLKKISLSPQAMPQIQAITQTKIFGLPAALTEENTANNFSAQEKPYKKVRWLADGIFIPYIKFPNNLKKYNFWAPSFLYFSISPNERWLVSLNPIFYVKPFFADVSLRLSYFVRPAFSLSLLLNDSIPLVFDSPLAYRKSGFNWTTSFQSPVKLTWQWLNISLQSGFYTYAPRLHSASNPYQVACQDFFAHVIFETSFSFIKQSSFRHRPFLSSLQKGFVVSTSIPTFYHLQSKKIFTLLQNNFQFYFPVVPLRLGLSLAWSSNMLLTSQGIFYGSGNNLYGVEKLYVPRLYEYNSFPIAYDPFHLLFGLDLELFLVTWDIEKSLPSLVLYLKKLLLTFGYRANVLSKPEQKENLYLDSVYAHLSLQLAPFVGGISAAAVTLRLEYAYPLRRYSGVKTIGNFRFIFDTNF